MGLINIFKEKKNKTGKFINDIDSTISPYISDSEESNETFVFDSVPKGQYISNDNNYNYQNNQYLEKNYQPQENIDNYNNYPNNNQNINYDNYQNQNYENYSISNQSTNYYESTENMIDAIPNNNYSQNNLTETNYNNETELPEILENIDDSYTANEETILDPLNNANNPIPVNPVAPVVEKEEIVEDEKVSTNIFTIFGMIIGMILSPGNTIVKNTKKYKSLSKSLFVTLWLTIVSLILCVTTRVVVGSFTKTFNSVTGSYNIFLNFNNALSIDNYLPYLILALAISFGAVILISLIYYASSFFNSKGITLGSYLALSNNAMIPIILGILVIMPITSVISEYLGIAVLAICFVYTIVSFIIGINTMLQFKSVNSQIYYNVFNLSLIIIVVLAVIVIAYNMNIISLPETMF